jgi:hypothetical protein
MRKNSNKQSPQNTNFPIWEKLYLDVVPDSYWENIDSIQIKNHVYIFPSIYNPDNKFYFTVDLENETIKSEEAEYEGLFHPVWDKDKTIYLFRFDNSQYSDFRYHIIEFNVESKKFTSIQSKGVPPKRRSDDFTSFYHLNSGKIYFLGGMQIYPGDNTGSLIYSFNTKEYEWVIEPYSGNLFNNNNNLGNFSGSPEFVNNNQGTTPYSMSSPYLSNRSGMSHALFSQDKVLLFGGKSLENNFNLNALASISQVGNSGHAGYTGNNFQNENFKTFFNEVESDEIFEYDLSLNKISKRQYTKLFEEKFIDKEKFNENKKEATTFSNNISPSSKFYLASTSQIRDNIFIHNNGTFFCYDLLMNELSLIKPLLFTPQAIKNSSMFFYNNYLYILGRFKHYEDCIGFKTSVENLVPKWSPLKEVSYEMLLNNKDCSDIIFVLNAGDKNREIHVNKKVMYNFSLPLKNIIINYSQNSNYYNFNDVSFIGVYNTLKFIYSNFNENISSYDLEIIQEMIDIIVRYRAKSLLNVALSHIKLSNEYALALYELANKYNLTTFKKSTYDYISENLHSGLFSKEKNVSESFELKKILFENFFCSHPVKIEVNTLGYDMKNTKQSTISQEKFLEIRNMCKNNKLMFCVNCKKVITEE